MGLIHPKEVHQFYNVLAPTNPTQTKLVYSQRPNKRLGHMTPQQPPGSNVSNMQEVMCSKPYVYADCKEVGNGICAKQKAICKDKCKMAQATFIPHDKELQSFSLLSGHTIPAVGLGTWMSGSKATKSVFTAIAEVYMPLPYGYNNLCLVKYLVFDFCGINRLVTGT